MMGGGGSIVHSRSVDLDALGVACGGELAVVSVIKVRGGIVQGELEFQLSGGLEEEPGDFLYAFISQWYLDHPPPREILLPFQVEGLSSFASSLGNRSSAPLLKWGVRGFRKRLVEMAAENARQGLASILKGREAWFDLARSLKDLLGLGREPQRVEGVDISNTSGAQAVGSFVAFQEGVPLKQGYRRYNLDYMKGPDDYAMIGEAIRRRLRRRPLPDLILVDGGPGQLEAARLSLREAGLEEAVALVAIAKDRGRGFEQVYSPRGEPLILPRSHPVLLFLQRVRDEAHRFGLQAHRKRRVRASLRSLLMEIEGVGPRRFHSLMERFGSLGAIAEASEEEIAAVQGISPSLAKRIKAELRIKVKEC